MMKREKASAASRGYDARWRRERELFLREHPLCVMCMKEGRTTAANVVDHVEPHRGNMTKFWDRDNWQSLCKPHHDRHKQSTEARGYDTTMGLDGWPIDPNHPTYRST